jgi:U11-48K-like CHHC zinc finger
MFYRHFQLGQDFSLINFVCVLFSRMNSYSSPAPGFDNMLSCPYNSAHQILRHRMQTHLVKCRKSYPDVAMKTCPFDTTHKIPENEMKFHIDTCPNRGAMESYKYSVNTRPAKEEPDSTANMSLRQMQDQAANDDQDDDENWDDVSKTAQQTCF